MRQRQLPKLRRNAAAARQRPTHPLFTVLRRQRRELILYEGEVTANSMEQRPHEALDEHERRLVVGKYRVTLGPWHRRLS
jgi:hypothetical protein